MVVGTAPWSPLPLSPNTILSRQESWYPHQMKVRAVVKLLQADGWYHVPARGGHRQFKHPTKPGRVTVSGKMGHDLPRGTLNSILKQAGLKP
jgi:predicted RNA binding protein YcfA (HicA-like mRNA interferase family)